MKFDSRCVKLLISHVACLGLGIAGARIANRMGEAAPGDKAGAVASDGAPASGPPESAPEAGETAETGSVAARTERVLENRIPVNRRAAFQEVLQSIRTLEDARQCLNVFLQAERDGKVFPGMKQALLERAGAAWGLDFLREFLPSDPNTIPNHMLGSVLKGWASADPAGAAAWMNQTEGSFKLMLTHSLLEGIGPVDPDYVKRTFPTLPPPVQTNAVDVMIDVAAQDGGLDGIKEWHEGFKERLERETGFGPHVQDMQNRAFNQVANRVLLGDSDAALAWLDEQWSGGVGGIDPTGKPPSGLNEFVRNLVDRNPDELGAWLNIHKLASGYDRLAQMYAEEIASLDPDSADAWAESIRDIGIRNSALRNVEYRKAYANGLRKKKVELPAP